MFQIQCGDIQRHIGGDEGFSFISLFSSPLFSLDIFNKEKNAI